MERVPKEVGRVLLTKRNPFAKQFTEVVAFALAISGMIGVVISLSSEIATASVWGPRELVSGDPANDHWSYAGAVAADPEGNVFVVWEDLSELDGSGPDYDVYIKKWVASRQAWAPRILVTDDNVNNTAHSHVSEIETDSFGNVHVVWQQNGILDGDGDDADIYWRMWDVTSGSWMPRLLITDEVENFRTSTGPRLASDSFGNVHLTWDDWSPLIPHDGVQYRMWNGTAKAWEPRMTVTTNSSGGRPDIAVDPSGNVHVAWADYANISGASTHGNDIDVFYRKLDISTKTWGPFMLVTFDDNDMDQMSSNYWGITTDVFGNAHFIWDEMNDYIGNQSGDTDIFYRKLDAATGLWGPRVLISEDEHGSTRGRICSDPFGNVHIVWQDRWFPHGSGSPDVDFLYRNYDVASGSWGSVFEITDDLGDDYQAYNPDINSDDQGNIFVIWTDAGGHLGSGDDHDVFLRRTSPGQIPFPRMDLRTDVVNGDDVLLTWTGAKHPDIDYYLIYGSADPASFDFFDPIHDTSGDIDPIRMDWIDVDAVSSSRPQEYYYMVRAIGDTGAIGIPTNVAGKWTKSFSAGLKTFSLPFEPFEARSVSWYVENIPNVAYVRWMDSTGYWITHYKGMEEGINDVPVQIGIGYEIFLNSETTYTFTGYSASAIRYREGFGDSASFRDSLSAQKVDFDIVLTWNSLAGATEYRIFKSNERNGLHDPSLEPMVTVPSTQNAWTDSGVLSTEGEYYYLVIPVDSEGELGSSTYSVGVITTEYQPGSDTFALPLKLAEVHTLD
ncbi:MAG: hypothetical protein KAW09_09340, partial [Thermoplasmata archaeon]|nr:hypothetical protein [Thermoplasmata archaeon]